MFILLKQLFFMCFLKKKNKRLLVYRICIIGLVSISTGLSANSIQIRQSYILEQQGQYKKAYTLMYKLANSNARHYLAHLRAGWLAYLSKNYAGSLYYYRKAVVLAPNAIEPRLGLMLPLIATGRYKEAETVGRAVLYRDFKNYLARSRLAWTLYKAKRYKEAQAYYYYLILDYPADGEMYVGIASSLHAQKKITSACYYYKIADVILPSDKRVSQGMLHCKK